MPYGRQKEIAEVFRLTLSIFGAHPARQRLFENAFPDSSSDPQHNQSDSGDDFVELNRRSFGVAILQHELLS